MSKVEIELRDLRFGLSNTVKDLEKVEGVLDIAGEKVLKNVVENCITELQEIVDEMKRIIEEGGGKKSIRDLYYKLDDVIDDLLKVKAVLERAGENVLMSVLGKECDIMHDIRNDLWELTGKEDE